MTESTEMTPKEKLEFATQEMERRRARAYADPITGSDAMFSKSVRLQAMGRYAESETIQEQAVARFQQIQLDYPLPVGAPIETTPKTRTTITMRQARLYMQQNNMLEAVEEYVQTLDAFANIEWQYSTIIEMSSPLVEAIVQRMELTGADLERMFSAAGEL